MEVESKADADRIPDAAYRVGFNDYYETPEGDFVAVPNGTTVPGDWILVSD